MDYGLVIEQAEARAKELEAQIAEVEAEEKERRELLKQVTAEATKLRQEKMDLDQVLRSLRKLTHVASPETPKPATDKGDKKSLAEQILEEIHKLPQVPIGPGLVPTWPQPYIHPYPATIPWHPGDPLHPSYVGDPLPGFPIITCGSGTLLRADSNGTSQPAKAVVSVWHLSQLDQK